jgi:competence protein ComEC
MKNIYLSIIILLAQSILYSDIIISELCDPYYDYRADRYIEIYNTGNNEVDLTNWSIKAIGNSIEIFTWQLSGFIQAGEALTAGANSLDLIHNFSSDGWVDSNSTWNGNVGDGAALYNGTTLIDNASTHGNFENKSTIRNINIGLATTTFNSAEWTSFAVDYAGAGNSTPSYHNCDYPQETLSKMTIHFIDIGQGDATLIQNEGKNYLIDSGRYRSDRKLLNYLRSINVDTLDACLMTHPDFDHIGAFEGLIDSNIVINRFVMNRDTTTSAAFANLLLSLHGNNIPIDTVETNSDLGWNFYTEVLSPNYGNNFNDVNENSIVFKAQYGNISFLFTGDSELQNNDYLMANYLLDIDVLKVSHHGAVNGTTDLFLDATTPVVSFISAGNNSFGHPAESVLDMLDSIGSSVFCTADDYNTWFNEVETPEDPVNGSDDTSVDDDIILETDGITIWVNGQVVYPQGVPTNLTVTSVTATEVNLSWNAVTGATIYNVYRSENPYSGFVKIGYTDTLTYTDNTISAGNKYFYYITAVNSK